MIFASQPHVFESGATDMITVTLPRAYLRLAVCCLTSLDVIWADANGAVTSLTDEETDLLDNAVALATEAANEP